MSHNNKPLTPTTRTLINPPTMECSAGKRWVLATLTPRNLKGLNLLGARHHRTLPEGPESMSRRVGATSEPRWGLLDHYLFQRVQQLLRSDWELPKSFGWCMLAGITINTRTQALIFVADRSIMTI